MQITKQGDKGQLHWIHTRAGSSFSTLEHHVSHIELHKSLNNNHLWKSLEMCSAQCGRSWCWIHTLFKDGWVIGINCSSLLMCNRPSYTQLAVCRVSMKTVIIEVQFITSREITQMHQDQTLHTVYIAVNLINEIGPWMCSKQFSCVCVFV